jgi:hypothetical protein
MNNIFINIFHFQQERTDETIPSQISSQSGIILWIIVNVLRRQQQRRNTLIQSRRNTITSIDASRRNMLTSVDAPPTISETMTVN